MQTQGIFPHIHNVVGPPQHSLGQDSVSAIRHMHAAAGTEVLQQWEQWCGNIPMPCRREVVEMPPILRSFFDCIKYYLENLVHLNNSTPYFTKPLLSLNDTQPTITVCCQQFSRPVRLNRHLPDVPGKGWGKGNPGQPTA